jgi:hypothetical protein
MVQWDGPAYLEGAGLYGEGGEGSVAEHPVGEVGEVISQLVKGQ